MKNNSLSLLLSNSGCEEAISVYETDTGKLIESIWTPRYFDCISSLNFSPNYKYLVSTDGEQNFAIFTWPDLKFCYYIELSGRIRVSCDKLFSRYFIF